MYVLVNYNDEENQMKNEGARVVKSLCSYIFGLDIFNHNSIKIHTHKQVQHNERI